MAFKCWSCKGTHDTIAQSKLCHNRRGVETPAQRDLPGEPAFKTAMRRHEDNRQDLFSAIREAGARVEVGLYALRNGDGAANDISFYEVSKPEVGRWAGRTFVNRMHSDDRTKIAARDQLRVLLAIAADPQGATALYGQKIGSCGVCGRTLTNQNSRESGIGPVCARKRGWDAA